MGILGLTSSSHKNISRICIRLNQIFRYFGGLFSESIKTFNIPWQKCEQTPVLWIVFLQNYRRSMLFYLGLLSRRTLHTLRLICQAQTYYFFWISGDLLTGIFIRGQSSIDCSYPTAIHPTIFIFDVGCLLDICLFSVCSRKWGVEWLLHIFSFCFRRNSCFSAIHFWAFLLFSMKCDLHVNNYAQSLIDFPEENAIKL